jgi:hypothetical protein
MPTSRLPGVQRSVLGATPAGPTAPARAGASPAPLGAVLDGGKLTDGDRWLIELGGRHAEGTPYTLTDLMMAYDRRVQAWQQAVRNFGEQSGMAVLELSWVRRLEELLQQARSPHGVAREKLRKVLHHAKHDPAAWCKQRKEDLEGLLSRASYPGIGVTEGQLHKAVVRLLAAERYWVTHHPDVQDSPGPNGGTLIARASELFYKLRKEQLEALLKKASSPDGHVTDKQVAAGVKGVVAGERQKQLLGVTPTDADAEELARLVHQSVDVVVYRHKMKLQQLLKDVKRPGNTVTRRRIKHELAALLGHEQQRQLLGAPDDDPAEREVWELITEADKAYAELKKTPPRHVGHGHRVVAPPPHTGPTR